MELKIRREKWNAMAAFHLLDACDDLYPLDDLAFDVQSGQCVLFNVYEGDDDHHIFSFVIRIEGGREPEMVVVAAGGYARGYSLFKTLSPFVEKMARDMGIRTLRAHTKTPGRVRLIERAGWQQSEVVLRKAV